ncbi:MAG: PD40 domain-containing protein [Ignavibacteria bacterium]|nr:PD40 domain-containing protein [Ignavibacteria bacterium]
MKKELKVILTSIVCVLLAGCSSSNSPTTIAGFTGTIYYSTAGNIYQMKLSDQSQTELYTNARHPDITAKGEILCVEGYPNTRIIYSDLTGASRVSLLESESYTGPIHKYYMNKPRMSYNQKYVVYEGDNVHNPNTYVIDATSGNLVATIGDYSKRQPMISPSWAPDGSIYVQGWTSMNNGIYKVSSDFSTVERIDPSLSNVYEPNVSPDGTSIAFIRDSKVYMMGIDGTNPVQLYTSNLKFNNPTWSPDSKYIAAVCSGHIYIFDVNAKTATEITKVHYVGDDSQMCWR